MSFTELDGWLSDRAAADEFSGVVLIRRGERTEFSGAYGWASRRWPVPMTEAMRFDTASITKLFTSVAALRLVDQGKLDLDTPITEIVDLAGTTISPAVTIRHLLTHSSGIADDADEEAGESYEALWVDKPVYSVIEARDYLPQFAFNRRTSRQVKESGTATSASSWSGSRSRSSPEPRTATTSAPTSSPARA
jgi:CubicO group peptidase (beta-lactamase class C family)